MAYWILRMISFWMPIAPFLHLSHIILHCLVSCTDLKFFRVKDCHVVFLSVCATSIKMSNWLKSVLVNGPKFQPLAPFFSVFVRGSQFWLFNIGILLVWREVLLSFLVFCFFFKSYLSCKVQLKSHDSNPCLPGDLSHVLSHAPSPYITLRPIRLTISYV